MAAENKNEPAQMELQPVAITSQSSREDAKRLLPSNENDILRAEVEALKQQLQTMKLEMEHIKNESIPKPKPKNYKTESTLFRLKKKIKLKQNILSKANRHKKRALYFTFCRFFILFIFGGAYFAYQFYLYQDVASNSITRTSIQHIDNIMMPYFYVYAAGFLYWLDTGSIFVYDGGNNTNSSVAVFNTTTYNISSFVYDETKTSWSWVTDPLYSYEGLLIPPYGMTLDVYERTTIFFICYGVGNETVRGDNAVDGDVGDEILESYSNGYSFGLFWSADPVTNLDIHEDLTAAVQSYSTNWEQLQYTFVSTDNYYFIDVFEESNDITGYHQQYYTTNLVASIIDENYAWYYHDGDGNTNEYWDDYFGYQTALTLYPNPSGGGLKQVLNTRQLRSFFDVLSNTGGIFAPINTVSLIILTFMIFGCKTDCLSLKGFAPMKPLDDTSKHQIKTYLIELGLLHANAIEDGMIISELKEGGNTSTNGTTNMNVIETSIELNAHINDPQEDEKENSTEL